MQCKTTAPSGVAEGITLPAEIAGIPTEWLLPMRDGSVREYDRPFFTTAEGVGRYQDPEARRVRVHSPGSEVAEFFRPIMEERNKPRPATRVDAHMHDEAALLEDSQVHEARKYGLAERAEKHAARAERHKRRAWMIRRHLNTAEHAPITVPLDTPRPTALASPREHRARRSSSPSRAGPSDDEGPSDEPPPAGRLCECGCGFPLTGRRPQCRYLNVTHRKRHQRERDRQTPDRVALRAVENGTATRPRRCGCRPAHNLHDRGVCVKCGHARVDVAVAWITEARDLRSKQLVARAPARRNPMLGDGKGRPPNEFVDESIIGRAA
jgi:hypothetical protein